MTPETRKLPSAKLTWTRKTSGVPGWTTDGFDILESKDGKYAVLIAFDHDPVPGDDSEFWRRRFDMVEKAMNYAECM